MNNLRIITNRFGSVAGTPQVPTLKKSDYSIHAAIQHLTVGCSAEIVFVVMLSYYKFFFHILLVFLPVGAWFSSVANGFFASIIDSRFSDTFASTRAFVR